MFSIQPKNERGCQLAAFHILTPCQFATINLHNLFSNKGKTNGQINFYRLDVQCSIYFQCSLLIHMWKYLLIQFSFDFNFCPFIVNIFDTRYYDYERIVDVNQFYFVQIWWAIKWCITSPLLIFKSSIYSKKWNEINGFPVLVVTFHTWLQNTYKNGSLISHDFLRFNEFKFPIVCCLLCNALQCTHKYWASSLSLFLSVFLSDINLIFIYSQLSLVSVVQNIIRFSSANRIK